jgi:hypothetical protein
MTSPWIGASELRALGRRFLDDQTKIGRFDERQAFLATASALAASAR